ncbi:hypothetical protein SR41_16590 [Sphingomonas melonis]|uniref:Uncharacterized protein n=1 Tax=Sphingomonas melonis TaxID=152682 RepID=A0A0D1JXQ5_9SPHN|nr:hypothetical protein [Sphingomonas melonis]KIU25998.1 hypothetical protein SR41_16590 [Sphingomonas melonis]
MAAKLMQVMAERQYSGEHSPMPDFAILIDDGAYVASSANSEHTDMDAAILSTVRTATLLATGSSAVLTGRRTFECEVQDRASGENRAFQVMVEAAFRTPPDR